MRFTSIIRDRLLLLAALGPGMLPTAALAQQAAAEVPPDKAKQFIDLLSDPQVKAWLEAKAATPAAAEPELSIHDAVLRWEGAVRDRLGALVEAIPRIPEELSRAAGVVARDVNFGTPGLVIGILAVLIAVGFGAGWLARLGLGRLQGGDAAGATEGDGRTLLSGVAELLAFSVASIGSFLAFSWPPLLRQAVLTFLLAFIAFRIVRLAMRVQIASTRAGDAADPTVAAADAADPTVAAADGTAPTVAAYSTVAASDAADPTVAAFWRGRVDLIACFFLFGWAIVALMPELGFSIEVKRLVGLAFGLGILATAIEIVWRRPDSSASPLRRVLLTLFLVALWLAWAGGMLGLLWLGIFALLLPPLVRGVGAMAEVFAARVKRTGALGIVLHALIVRGARALVIAGAVAWLGYVMRFGAAGLMGDEAFARLVGGLLNAIVILLVADLVWRISKELIAHRLSATGEAGAGPDDAARRARLMTLLPILQNVLAVFIGTVALLTILAGMGVQIVPLVAGAGVFGVAIGFGSQTLVKDVLSGIFYMFDDAFRVGEYIQSGSYKGTVESFSLRSVRLRHHRGSIFTVPFGELGAIQNMSRDWVIEKMTIGITYDSDVDKARKIVKKIGQELAADPEFAADTIQPLKMQGIDNFGDFAIELRMKLMTKPGVQFAIKRRAFMMIKKEFAENGIKIAVPTVHIEGGGGGGEAAAAQQMLNMNRAVAPAANEA